MTIWGPKRLNSLLKTTFLVSDIIDLFWIHHLFSHLICFYIFSLWALKGFLSLSSNPLIFGIFPILLFSAFAFSFLLMVLFLFLKQSLLISNSSRLKYVTFKKNDSLIEIKFTHHTIHSFKVYNPIGCQVVSHNGFMFLITNIVEHLFRYLLAICISYLEKCLFKCFKNGLFVTEL